MLRKRAIDVVIPRSLGVVNREIGVPEERRPGKANCSKEMKIILWGWYPSYQAFRSYSNPCLKIGAHRATNCSVVTSPPSPFSDPILASVPPGSELIHELSSSALGL